MNRTSLLLALAVVLMWSTVATAFKLTLALISPLQMLWIAVATSFVILLIATILQQKLRLAYQYLRQSGGYFLLLALLNPTLYYLILFAAYDRLPAQQAQALNYTWAVVLSIMAVPFLGQTFTLKKFISIILAYSGVIVIATQGNLLSLDFKNPLGVILGVGSSLFFASYWILNTRNPRDAVVSLLLCFGLSLPMLSVLMLIQGEVTALPWQAVAGGIYIGTFEMGFAFLLWMQAMRMTDNTAQLSNLVYLSPPLSLILLSTLADEPVMFSTIIGLVLIISGVLIQQLKGKPSSAAD
ncbi:DMT family transporter [Amphritea sp. 2_MG-2023]|uniref:DMT family transporter n=1 Tax=Amphritea TaxID=515417 RepID=UPI001C076F6A|nr:DMT family transporter [Amphritea sp. 2_MG-2023]MBU2965565.1 DMT family transporter [Amphritea atlantica]MDO6418720.1 DMT family transporter [Amphritea sp. 2_MG-2023]MDX2423591.1 DMT family transporter [Amphritea sp.]